jgi:hypothetical protein
LHSNMDNGSGGKSSVARRNQAEDDGASQPSNAIDSGPTWRDVRLFNDDDAQSIATEDSSTRPGATRINFRQADDDDDDATIIVGSQALEYSSPLLQAELAPDVDELVAQALKKHLDTVAAQALQSQTDTLPQQQRDVRQEVEHGRNGNEPIMIADAVIMEQPKLCGVVPRRYTVFGFLVILMVATATTLGVVLPDNNPVTVNTPAPVSVNAPAPVVSTPPTETSVSPTPAPTPAPVGPPIQAYYALRSQLESSMCLDVRSSSKDNFTPLQLIPCNGTPAQMFVLSTNPIRIYSALGDGTSCVEGDINPGTIFPGFSDTVFLYSPCVDSWRLFADGRFVNGGWCLAAHGSAVSVEQCNGGNNQKWSPI